MVEHIFTPGGDKYLSIELTDKLVKIYIGKPIITGIFKKRETRFAVLLDKKAIPQMIDILSRFNNYIKTEGE